MRDERRGATFEAAAAAFLLVASLLSVVVVLEAGLRVYHGVKLARWNARLPPVEERALVPSGDPALIWEFNPGWKKGAFTINSLGMPDRERRPTRPEGVFRIAFVGDSLTANFGYVERDQIYLNVLGRDLDRLAADGREVEVLNFGVNGYGIQQSLRVAQTRVRAFDPDLIVAQLFLNDPYPSDTEYRQSAPRHILRLRDFLFRLLSPERFLGYSYVERLYDPEGWENLRAGFTGFAKLARRGAPVLAVLFPYLHPDAYGAWGFERLHVRYRALADENGLPLLDLHSAFAGAGLLDAPGPDPQHPDARGHALAARALLSDLSARGWLAPIGVARSPAGTGPAE